MKLRKSPQLAPQAMNGNARPTWRAFAFQGLSLEKWRRKIPPKYRFRPYAIFQTSLCF
jgi:hypothetical protein